MDRNNQPRYDERKRSRASISAVLRSIVAFYLAYLGWTIAGNSGGENTTMTRPVGWLICAAFTLAGIAFGVYTLKCYQRDLKEAQLPEKETELPSPERNQDED